jgi:putative phage-type endonuclease
LEVYAPEVLNGARLLGIYTAGSPEWHSERTNGIGGSEVGTILGLNPYESAYALWAKRTGRIPSEVKENWAIRFGKAFESPILGLWAEDHPEWAVYTTGTYEHVDTPYLHANPDALAYNPQTDEWMVIEVKTARNTWDEVPPGYIAQVLHYMHVLGIRRGCLVAVAGMTWNEYEVPYNEEMIEAQNSLIGYFWQSLKHDTRPSWDGSDATYHAVRAQHTDIDGSEVELGQLGLELINAQDDVDAATRNLNLIKSQVLDKMGNAKFGLVTNDKQARKVASRQIRGGKPSLIVNKKGM